MPRNPEEKPTFLQDVVTPKETEQAPEGFDLDREFGKGTKKRFAESLKTWIQLDIKNAENNVMLTEIDRERLFGYVAKSAFCHLILFGEWLLPKETEERLFNTPAFRLQLGLSRVIKKALTGQQDLTPQGNKVLEEKLRSEIENYFPKDPLYAAEQAALYRMLFEKIFWTAEQGEQMVATLQERIRRNCGLLWNIENRDPFVFTTIETASLRILRAHDLKFIPGKGIEVIDTPPQGFTQTPIPPMPEERKF